MSPPGKRRGGPLDTDRPHVAVTAKRQHNKGTTPVHKPLLHAVAQATLVTARTGRQRYLLVYRCHCGARHVSHARVVADMCRRQAACGLGLVELHLSQAVAS